MATAAPEQQQRWIDLQEQHRAAAEQRREAALRFAADHDQDGELAAAARTAWRDSNDRIGSLRGEAKALYQEASDSKETDNDFIFPYFFLRNLPIGILGLVIAAIFIAAMSSLDAQLNSLATSSVMDLYARFKPGVSERQIVTMSRWMTLFWGLFATISAYYVASLGPMIEVVNMIGSMFYGSLFGVFLLGWLLPGARGRDGWIALSGGFLATMFTHFVINAEKIDLDGRQEWPVGFLWYNLIGVLGVIGTGLVLAMRRRR
jgi:Na+/proline symporter